MMAGRTDVGKKRKNNEDSLYFSEEEGFAIVADGMGGLEAGEVASQMVVQGMAAHFIRARAERAKGGGRPMEQLGRLTVACREWLSSANAELYLAAKSRERRHKMGSTIAFFAECADHVVVGNLGDTRVYLLREDKLTQLSVDHSWAAESPEAVPEGEMRRAKKFVTRALGIQARIEPEFLVEKMRRGDLLLACSDGMTEEVTDRELEGMLREVKEDLWKGTEDLIIEANGRGGADNVSVVLAKAIG